MLLQDHAPLVLCNLPQLAAHVVAKHGLATWSENKQIAPLGHISGAHNRKLNVRLVLPHSHFAAVAQDKRRMPAGAFATSLVAVIRLASGTELPYKAISSKP